MTIEVSIVADSLSEAGHRLTTFSLKYPRFIHAEFMTHRIFSRNASSSRAIPVEKMISWVNEDPAMPTSWGMNQPGMQADKELPKKVQVDASLMWLIARDNCVNHTRNLVSWKVHKQVANRILEPWHHISVVCTATDFENFFDLRIDSAAQPEIRDLAVAMAEEYFTSTPREAPNYAYHTPYVDKEDVELVLEDYGMELSFVLNKLSVARCARVSYLNHEGKRPEVEKDIGLHDMLLSDRHMSPFEHVARPVSPSDKDTPTGNFTGWVQYRKELERHSEKPVYLKEQHLKRMKDLGLTTKLSGKKDSTGASTSSPSASSTTTSTLKPTS